ncbi:hypothetical protein LOK49_LG12G00788 [Camellia lanceoleosa]|uniref:Uncharacterized protein n=1 Tax=Camellia lanceoleosa TaxID=1840588 RepID=A0ACC0FVV7_9ERIC|nr:hypothetical protein LOK49_LG12G00788 [Camellia lanceoleosa]
MGPPQQLLAPLLHAPPCSSPPPPPISVSHFLCFVHLCLTCLKLQSLSFSLSLSLLFSISPLGFAPSLNQPPSSLRSHPNARLEAH